MAEKPEMERRPLFVEAVAANAKVESNASLSSKVRESLQKLARGGPLPKKYFWVHDLINPAAAYWARKAPGVEEPPEIARRMASGKRRHKQAGYWFSSLPAFVLGEGRIEGAYVGLEGVVGKVDFLLDRSVLEYKTKVNLPSDVEVLWRLYPQDIEQTLFYAALLPGSSDTHYLVFDSGGSFRAFRLRIRDKGSVRDLLARRMWQLREAISVDDPSRLGQCRYFQPGCKFERTNVCGCGNLPLIDTANLRSAVEIKHDVEFERQAAAAYANAAFTPDEIWWWDLFSPRRRFLDEAPTYGSDSAKNAARWLLEEGVYAMGLSPGRARYQAARERAANLGIRAPPGLIQAMRAKEGSNIVPFVARAQHGSVKREWQVAPWFVAELAVACAVVDSSRGILFVVYPDDDQKVAAYDVSFPNLDSIRRIITQAASEIRVAEKAKNPNLVPKCPAFMWGGCSSKCLCRGAT